MWWRRSALALNGTTGILGCYDEGGAFPCGTAQPSHRPRIPRGGATLTRRDHGATCSEGDGVLCYRAQGAAQPVHATRSREFEYIRHGTKALIAAFDVATGDR